MARRVGPLVQDPSGEAVLVGSRLARLYLEQGHLDEAERIYRAVASWRGEDREIREGLDEVRERRARQRKIARLRRYLACLRRGARGAPQDGDPETPD